MKTKQPNSTAETDHESDSEESNETSDEQSATSDGNFIFYTYFI